MDTQVRFCSEKLKKAVTRYWGSEFHLGSDTETLSDSLMKGLVALPIEKQHQLAVDGPKVNWKILRLIMDLEIRKSTHLCKILDVVDYML